VQLHKARQGGGSNDAAWAVMTETLRLGTPVFSLVPGNSCPLFLCQLVLYKLNVVKRGKSGLTRGEIEQQPVEKVVETKLSIYKRTSLNLWQ